VSTRSWDGLLLARLKPIGYGVALPFAALLTLYSPDLLAKPPSPAKSEEVSAVFRKSVPTSIADLRNVERRVELLVGKVSRAVVAVRVGMSGGSAVVISPDGLVLCAAHVCGTPNTPVHFIFSDGRTARGETLGTNHAMDAGLMKITDPGPWPFVDVGDPESIRLGDWVLALGHPGGFDPERSAVARLGRVISLEGLLQTDCTLMAGDSGGPLFDMSGHVIGIHSRISESASDNYHVPIGAYLESWERLAKGENWGDERPAPPSTIGVRGLDDPAGCRIERVSEGGPAFRAGLLPGDLIVRINGEPVTDADCLVQFVRQTEAGRELTLAVKRAGVELDLKVTVEPRRGPGRRGRPGP
jgi:serine protease Do